MRRAATSAANDAALADKNDTVVNASSRRSRRKRAAQQATRHLSIFFLAFTTFLVLADLLYLYNFSSQALGGEKNKMLEQRKNANLLRSPDKVTLQYKYDSTSNATGGRISPGRKVAKPVPEHREGQDELELDTDNNDKGPILKILSQAGIDIHKDLDKETIDALPSWSQVQRLFGDRPRIYGLDRCQEFRESTDPTIRFFGIAGTFNTGTNLLSELMIKNCQITERMLVYGNQSKGMRWQVPWGKHYPAFRRGTHETSSDKAVPYSNSLPLVTTRDPYAWMQSMCHHAYAAKWFHTKEHCPNLVPTEQDIQVFPHQTRQSVVPIRVSYADDFVVQHDSLAHFWNDWYQLYFNASFPRIIVRFEDLLFYGQEVTETLCACGGGVPREDRPGFEHISESAKLGTRAHGNQKTNLVSALIKYGNHDHRIDQMTAADLHAAKQALDPHLLDSFGYYHPDDN